jgi:ribose transport system substrate-binding protein
MRADAPWIKTPQTARFIDSGVLDVTAANLGTYKDDLRNLTKDILAKFKTTYMSCK